MTFELMIPAFIAGVFTFLAPCTLPLVPGYLGFISGTSFSDLSNPAKAARVRRRMFLNGVFYVLGFSLVFIFLGSLIGWLGGALFAEYRWWLTRIGGIFIVIFGLFMVDASLAVYRTRVPWLRWVRLPFSGWLNAEHSLHVGRAIKPGNPLSSTLFGAAFAIGWTPCVGPVLGAILTLAATEAGAGSGALLLGVFSAGLAVPFLVLAGGVGYFSQRMNSIMRLLPFISAIGGIFIVFLGGLVLTNTLGLWVSFFFSLFGFISYESIIDYL